MFVHVGPACRAGLASLASSDRHCPGIRNPFSSREFMALTMRARAFPLFMALTILAAVELTGCSRGGGTVEGEVKLDGKPLAGADIVFEGDATSKLGGFTGKTDENGKFLIRPQSPIQEGKYRVLISKYVDKKGKPLDPEEFDQLKAAGKLKNLVPGKYNHPTESQLIADLKPGQNVLQPFNLKSQ